MNNPYVLFFSERCRHSEKFYNLLRQHGKLHLFRLVCVDNLRRIPKGITSVPTIIVPGYNVPLVGDDVFNWLESILQPPQYNQQQQFNRQSQNMMRSQAVPNQNSGFNQRQMPQQMGFYKR